VAATGGTLSYDTGNFFSPLHKFSQPQASRLCLCFSLLSDTWHSAQCNKQRDKQRDKSRITLI